MLIRERMEETIFSPSEQIIVDYLLGHQHALDKLSTTSIAKETYSSKSTIVNVAKKLNFHGWSELKQALQKEFNYYHQHHSDIDANYPFQASDNALEIAHKIATLKKQTIDETANLNSFYALHHASEILAQASHIHLFALSNNLLISQEFIYNLRRINRRCDIHLIQGEGRMAATMAQTGECGIIISYSGETQTLVEIAEILHQRNIPFIAITNIGESSISRLASETLRITTREKLYSKISTFSTDTAFTYILDVLYSIIFAMDYNNNLSLRRNSSKTVETSRKTRSDILKESTSD